MKNTRAAKFSIRIAVFYLILTGFCQTIHAQSEVRFRLVRDAVIVVSLIANDQGPYDFVLDTGTNSTIVDTQVARRMSLVAAGHLQLITAARAMTVDQSSFRSLSMGSASAKDVEVLVQDLSEMRTVDSRIVGIVGQNFLRQFNYLIDYKRRSIRVEQADEIMKAIDGNHTPVEINEGLMLVSSQLQSKTQLNLKLLLDTGANNLTLFRPATLGLDKAPAGNWTTNTGSDQSGTATGRVKMLTVGAEQFHNITAALPPAAADQGRVEDGSLPVAFFHSMYVNNREGFVVLNAGLKTNVQQ